MLSSMEEKDVNPTCPEDVSLYVSPWVSGTRAGAYFGPLCTEMFVADTKSEKNREKCFINAEKKLLLLIKTKAHKLGANSVVGLEITVDPFHKTEEGTEGILLVAVGTAAKLEPLF